MNKNELLAKRATAIEQARAILDNAEKEERTMTAEEDANYKKAFDAAKGFKEQIEKIDADERRKLELETAEAEVKASGGRRTELQEADGGNKPKVIELRKSADGIERSVVISASESRLSVAFRNYLLTGNEDKYLAESRALQKDIDASGGYLSPPMEFMAQLIQAKDNLVFMRQLANVLPPLTTAESVGCPSLDTDPADPTWTSEIGTISEDSDMAFGRRELTPHPLRKALRVSRTLLRRSTIPVDSLVSKRLAYKFAVVEENNFLNGSGAGQPLGVMTASNNGIPTSRNYSTGNTTTAITFDGLKGCKYNLKPQYRQSAVWIYHTNALLMLSKLKDGEGRYIWSESVRVGEPDRLLNLPYYESVYMPYTFGAGLYVGILGDFSNYWIVDALTMKIQTILELYAATNQTAFFAEQETDGMPVLAEAFSRVVLAAG